MSVKNLAVSNINNNFSISFLNRTGLDYNVLEVTQPGYSIIVQEKYAGRVRIKFPPRNVDPQREDISIKFLVSENYDNWFELYSWIRSYKDGEYELVDLMTDIIITHYDLNKNIIRKVILKDCFPNSLSSITYSVTENKSVVSNFTCVFSVNKILIETP